MRLGIDLNQIEEQKPLTIPGPYSFTIRKAECKDNSAKDGKLIYCEMVPEGVQGIVFHRFSLKPGALSSSSTTISLKRFLQKIGAEELASLGEELEDSHLVGLQFTGTIQKDDFRGDDDARKLDKVGPLK
jgi:hypothetical protein